MEPANKEAKRGKFQSTAKLLAHPEQVNAWLDGKNPFPVMVDMDLTNACNHMCPSCVGSRNRENEAIPVVDDLQSFQLDNTAMPLEVAKRRIDEFAEVGVQAMIFGGGGDPTMHPNLAEIVRYVKGRGMEVAVNTNGMRLLPEVQEALTDCCTWVRISLDADGPAIYKIMHGMPEAGFRKTVANIGSLVTTRNTKGQDLVIGLTYLLKPETRPGIYGAAELARQLGVNYIRFRPLFNWHGLRNLQEKEATAIMTELDRAKTLETEQFEVSYPQDRLAGMLTTPERHHKKCYIPHFVTSVSAHGYLAPCCLMKGNPAFSKHGDLNARSFKDVWNDQARQAAWEDIDFSYCPTPCMQEGNNEVLWDIKQDFVQHGRRPAPLQADVPHKNFL